MSSRSIALSLTFGFLSSLSFVGGATAAPSESNSVNSYAAFETSSAGIRFNEALEKLGKNAFDRKQADLSAGESETLASLGFSNEALDQVKDKVAALSSQPAGSSVVGCVTGTLSALMSITRAYCIATDGLNTVKFRRFSNEAMSLIGEVSVGIAVGYASLPAARVAGGYKCFRAFWTIGLNGGYGGAGLIVEGMGCIREKQDQLRGKMLSDLLPFDSNDGGKIFFAGLKGGAAWGWGAEQMGLRDTATE